MSTPEMWSGSIPPVVLGRMASLEAEYPPSLTVVSGSYAYGTEREDSDFDVRGIFLARSEDHWRLRTPPESVRREDPDITFFEVRKFMKLASACNPNVLEILWSPVLTWDWAGRLLVENRHLFLSRQALRTYGGYAMS